MKVFQFRLKRVLELREMQLKREEAKLEQLWARRRQMEADMEALEKSFDQARSETRKQAMLRSSDLIALELYHARVVRERKQWEAKIAAHDGAVEQQKAAVLEARSRVRLLEKLREKRQAEWRIGQDKELEELAADFAAAQWVRERMT
jgi:flagellar export protein FliJ